MPLLHNLIFAAAQRPITRPAQRSEQLGKVAAPFAGGLLWDGLTPLLFELPKQTFEQRTFISVVAQQGRRDVPDAALAQFRVQKRAGAPLRFSAANERRTQQHSGPRHDSMPDANSNSREPRAPADTRREPDPATHETIARDPRILRPDRAPRGKFAPPSAQPPQVGNNDANLRVRSLCERAARPLRGGQNLVSRVRGLAALDRR